MLDLSEKYLADDNYPVGTLLITGGPADVTVSGTNYHDYRVVGVVTETSAYVLNSELTGEFVTKVALVGRALCRVQGPVSIGDCIVANGLGLGCTIDPDYWQPGCIVGKALTSYDGSDEGLIEIIVGRM
jgi:hypothetical protein